MANDDNVRRARHTQCLTRLAAGDGDPHAFDTLFAAAEHELSAMAARLMRSERAGHTLQPADLVNEAYLRLFDARDLSVSCRAHFVNLAARAMRQVLVEHARRHKAAKRGGGVPPLTLTGVAVQEVRNEVGVLEIHDALEKLGALDPRAAEVVEKRIFGGLTMDEVADALGLTRRTVQKDWRFATLWLRREFAGGRAAGPA